MISDQSRRTFLKRASVGAASVAGAAVVLPALGSTAAAQTTDLGLYPAVRQRLSTFLGATDDDRLAAFASYAGQQTYHGVAVELDEVRDYNFTRQFPLYSGFRMIGGQFGPQDQARGSRPVAQRVVLNIGGGNGGWLTLPAGNTYGLSLSGLTFDGTSRSRVFERNKSAVIWTSNFRDISMQNLASFMGDSVDFQPVDAVGFDGWWNINNVRDTFLNVGGSDCFINPSALFLDSPPSLLSATGVLARLSYLEKSVIQNFYLTAEQHMGLLISGSNARHRLEMNHMFIEGRNAGQPCYGALLRLNSSVTLRDSWCSYAMANPAASGRNDQGVIHIDGGRVLLDGLEYERANGVAESVPFVYVAGGTVRIRNISGVGFVGKPVVQVAAGVTVSVDDSVTVVQG